MLFRGISFKDTWLFNNTFERIQLKEIERALATWSHAVQETLEPPQGQYEKVHCHNLQSYFFFYLMIAREVHWIARFTNILLHVNHIQTCRFPTGPVPLVNQSTRYSFKDLWMIFGNTIQLSPSSNAVMMQFWIYERKLPTRSNRLLLSPLFLALTVKEQTNKKNYTTAAIPMWWNHRTKTS